VAPQYQAEGAIWITTESRGGQLTGPIRQEGLLESQAWIELLTSYAVLDPVVVQERLYLRHSPADSLVFQDFSLGERSARGSIGWRWRRTERGYTLSTTEKVVLEEGRLGGAVGPISDSLGSGPEFLPRDRVVAFSVVTPRDAPGTWGIVSPPGWTARVTSSGSSYRVVTRAASPGR
jgi:hypothetical protein